MCLNLDSDCWNVVKPLFPFSASDCVEFSFLWRVSHLAHQPRFTTLARRSLLRVVLWCVCWLSTWFVVDFCYYIINLLIDCVLCNVSWILVCKHFTHLARLHTRKLFSCVCLQGPTRLKCLDCSISVRVILKQASHSSHVMFSTQLDPPFTVPTQGTSTSSSQMFPSYWTPSAGPLFSRFPRQSLFTGYMSPTLRLKWAVKQHPWFYLREGAVSNVRVMTSLLLLIRLRRVTDRTWNILFSLRVQASGNRWRKITIKESQSRLRYGT